MSNTTYIEETIKQFSQFKKPTRQFRCIDCDGKYHTDKEHPDLCSVCLSRKLLTQAIRDTEVKTAKKFLALGRVHPEHVLSVSEPPEDVNYVVEHEKLEKLANSIINTNQED